MPKQQNHRIDDSLARSDQAFSDNSGHFYTKQKPLEAGNSPITFQSLSPNSTGFKRAGHALFQENFTENFFD